MYNEALQQIVELGKAASKKGGTNLVVTGHDRQVDVVKTAPDDVNGRDLVLVDGAQLQAN